MLCVFTKLPEGLHSQDFKHTHAFAHIAEFITACTADTLVFYRWSCSENQTKAVVTPKGE